MKSKFFSKHDVAGDKEFERDVEVTFQLKTEILMRVPEFAFRSIEVPTTADKQKVYDDAATELGVPRAKLDHALKFSRFFMQELTAKGDASGDDPNDLATDLTDHFKLPEDKAKIAVSYFSRLKTLAEEKLHLTLLKQAHSESALPILRSVTAHVDFRAVFDETYNYDQDVSKFSPKLLCTVPVGVVQLELRGAHNDAVFMQLSRRSLQALVDHLVALQKQMDIAESQMGAKEK
ncbi:MAG: hypothetical protein HZC54_12925 [Verrucomicrobia bacterium]|nr:hypothetical protein [Verrucomicrobiota bacterium]